MRYKLIDQSKGFVVLRDTGESGYDPWFCFDRKEAKFFDLTEDRAARVLAVIKEEKAAELEKFPMKKY